MDSRMDENLFELIKFISKEAAHILREAGPNDQDILSLTMEDLNKLLPGECNLKVREEIMGLINLFLQEQAGQSMDSIPDDVMKGQRLTAHIEQHKRMAEKEKMDCFNLASESEAVSYDPDILTSTRENLNELLPGERNSQVRSHIMGLIKVFLQEQDGQSMDSIPDDVMKAVLYDPDILTSKMENLNKLLPGEQNSQVRRHIMGLINARLQGQARQSMGSSPADVVKEKPVIMVFMHRCRDPSHMTDDKCLTECQPSSDNKVHFFHCAYHDSAGLLDCQENEQVVKAVRSALLSYADSQAGVPQSRVTCTQQDSEQQPMATKNAKRLNMTKDRGGTKPVDEESESEPWMTVPAMEHYTGPSGGLEQKPIAAKDGKRPHKSSKKAVKVHITGKTSNLHDAFMEKLKLQIELCSAESCSVILAFRRPPCQTGTDMDATMARVPETSAGSSPGVSSRFNLSPKKRVKVQIVVAGETFNTRETFIQKLNLRIEDSSPEKCDIILVFCPVVSRIGTDMEAAMARVTGNKPVILVFMHHCHNPSHMTNITVQPSRRNIEQIIHCAFHESRGLLRCQENEQAVKAVRSTLLRYVDSHDEVPQPKVPRTQPVMVQQPIAAQDANNPNTNDSKLPGEGTGPASKESESDDRMIVPPMEHSTGSRRGTPLVPKTGRFFSKSNWNASFESVKSSISRMNPNHNSLNYSSLVKVHTLVAGETFKTHETFIQKLKLQIELCSAASSSIILVFCPVVSQIGTDMEAAMDRVTENKPVILVFMHHCHNPSHMTNTTVQPSRSNIVQVVHCAFHENYGLLQCQENDQAVADVQAMLMQTQIKE